MISQAATRPAVGRIGKTEKPEEKHTGRSADLVVVAKLLWNVANAFDDMISKTLTCLSRLVAIGSTNKEGEPTRSCEPSIEDGIKSINDSCFPELRRSNGHATTPSSNSKYPVPSPYYRKGKRWQNHHLAESVRHNGEPLYLPGKGKGSWSNLFVYEFDPTANQVKLDPSMDVSDNSASLRLPLNMEPARGAHDRRRTCVLQS